MLIDKNAVKAAADELRKKGSDERAIVARLRNQIVDEVQATVRMETLAEDVAKADKPKKETTAK